ncbi:MAG: abortive infection family protein [Gemmatimonadota bacterium]
MALSRLVDDAKVETREPSHSVLEDAFLRTGLSKADPNRNGRPIGKAKRLRGVLHWAMDNDPDSGGRLAALIISLIKGCGGFRDSSPNFVGKEAIADATEAFRADGFSLGSDGDLRPVVLESLSGKGMTEALQAYVRRAQRGAEDAALLAGTSKDLVEATAAHVLTERFGAYPTTANFPTLLGQAFVALGLCVDPNAAASPQDRIDASLYALACATNALRNKQGVGHGRPFPASVNTDEARNAIAGMGIVASRLLMRL